MVEEKCMMKSSLIIKCPSFSEDGEIPIKHTGFAEDISPEILIEGLTEEAQSLAITLDDLDIPFMKEYNHWVIWNIPVSNHIYEGIPKVQINNDGSIQGIGYGHHKYRGPKQPPFIKKAHRYRLTVYAIDEMIDLSYKSRKKELLKKINGHIINKGEIVGWYKPKK